MTKNYYQDQLDRQPELLQESLRIRLSFLRHLLLVASSIAGLLLSLQCKSFECQYTGLVFLLSVALLLLGILSCAIALYTHSMVVEKARLLHLAEVRAARRANREVKTVFAGKSKAALICEKTCYVCFFLALLGLFAYSALIAA